MTVIPRHADLFKLYLFCFILLLYLILFRKSYQFIGRILDKLLLSQDQLPDSAVERCCLVDLVHFFPQYCLDILIRRFCRKFFTDKFHVWPDRCHDGNIGFARLCAAEHKRLLNVWTDIPAPPDKRSCRFS